ncbi:MAG: DHH family phosphoesterase [Planctomycetota bacterium]|nr:DHH family phosphoesterase [Planctomycetota bacterium]
MFTYESNTDLATVAKTVAGASRIVVTTHSKPDGDAMGSTLALKRALEHQLDIEILLMGPVTAPMRAIAGSTPWIDAEQHMPQGGEDLVLLVDTGAFSQVEPIADWIRARRDHVIVIDHHASGDDIGSLRLVDSTAASATMLVMSLIEAMGLSIQGGPESVAESLFCGLATDTGWFRFSNADARAFAMASQLLKLGINRDGLYRTIEETAQPTRLALQARALQSLEYVLDGRGAIMRLEPGDFKDTAGNPGELAGTVNLPLVVGTVEFSVLLYSEKGQETKVSFRSKPSRQVGGPFVDVSALAGQLGGGGHVHAAGARVSGSIQEAHDQVLRILSEQVQTS